MGRGKSNNIIKVILNLLFGVVTAISIISIATIIAINSTFVYRMMIPKYNLVEATGISIDRLMINYKGLINYLQNPFIEKLKFEDFTMSTYGEIHFAEVKEIFISLILIALTFILFVTTYVIICKVLRKNDKINRLIKNINLGSNILIGFFIVLGIIFSVNFSKAFIIFHKIFFRNDYWIFDESIDPIIVALPEGVFMVYGIIILAIIILFSIIIKVINKKNN